MDDFNEECVNCECYTCRHNQNDCNNCDKCSGNNASKNHKYCNNHWKMDCEKYDE